jgi:FkbM family methyltransferase
MDDQAIVSAGKMSQTNAITFAQRVLAALWWGKGRRPLEALLRRTVQGGAKVLAGPLRGQRFTGGLSQTMGIYEIHIQETILAHLEAGEVFYDVGANLGYFTLLSALRVGPRGCVCAFEPLPANVKHLQHVCSENNLTNCIVTASAVSDRPHTATLFVGPGNATPSLLSEEGWAQIKVPVTSLDTFASNHPWPDVIKVDVEGAEVEVLKGATHILKSTRPPFWIVEVHTQKRDEAVAELFHTSGYQRQYLESPRRQVEPYPRHLIAWKV